MENIEKQVVRSYITLEEILGQDVETLTKEEQGEFTAAKLGLIPFTAVNHDEYKQIKNDCIKRRPNGTGGLTVDFDEDRLQVKMIVAAVGKDTRSSFTFADKKLLAKFGAVSADQVVSKLLSPGEIFKMADMIQELSGFGETKKAEDSQAIKNS